MPLPENPAELPPLSDEFWATVDSGLRGAEVELSGAARCAIDAHVRLLLAWNAAINLTALRTPELIARGHVVDSLIATSALRAFGTTSILDIGSGAGFPGMPLALAIPVERLALVDSIGKKARFLGVVTRAVRGVLLEGGQDPPQMTALAARAEDLVNDPEHHARWQMVVARAIGTIAEVAELGLPLTARGGHVVAWKRDAGDGALGREIVQASRLSQAAGGSVPRAIYLPAAEESGLGGHCLVVIEKRGESPDRFPRPAAERRRSPLLS